MVATGGRGLSDCEPRFINGAGLGRLRRKAMGTVGAWRKVRCEADWNRPSGGGESWKSKVSCKAARRIDPGLLDEGQPHIGPLWEEARRRVGLHASLLRAHNRVAQ